MVQATEWAKPSWIVAWVAWRDRMHSSQLAMCSVLMSSMPMGGIAFWPGSWTYGAARCASIRPAIGAGVYGARPTPAGRHGAYPGRTAGART